MTNQSNKFGLKKHTQKHTQHTHTHTHREMTTKENLTRNT